MHSIKISCQETKSNPTQLPQKIELNNDGDVSYVPEIIPFFEKVPETDLLFLIG